MQPCALTSAHDRSMPDTSTWIAWNSCTHYPRAQASKSSSFLIVMHIYLRISATVFFCRWSPDINAWHPGVSLMPGIQGWAWCLASRGEPDAWHPGVSLMSGVYSALLVCCRIAMTLVKWLVGGWSFAFVIYVFWHVMVPDPLHSLLVQCTLITWCTKL